MKNTNLLIMFFISSCSMIAPERTFIEMMEEPEYEVFTPREDFAVIPGDTGKDYRDKTEILRRTPATEFMQQQQGYSTSLESELGYLESIQNAHAMAQYRQVRDKFTSTSERIYFLKIGSMNERKDYLISRGMLLEQAQYPDSDYYAASQVRELLMGMSKSDVTNTWGRPIRKDIAGHPAYQNERWAFYMDGATKYVFFENGKVAGWSDSP
ncbi:MAG: hypothetical protein JNM93_08220 [Bacteriovoracaceae bacterium]|nr:hypothetical protein [Bacteriovoracaceae bacterium]